MASNDIPSPNRPFLQDLQKLSLINRSKALTKTRLTSHFRPFSEASSTNSIHKLIAYFFTLTR